MNWDDIRNWGPILLMFVNTAITVAVLRGKARKEELVAIKTDVRALALSHDQHDTRLTKIEGEMVHVPAAHSVHGLQLSMTELKGELSVLTERLRPVAAISDRLQDFLMEQARR